jgi:hypothetical protein
VVTVVLTLRKELWIVYFGMKGERMRYCVVDGTVGRRVNLCSREKKMNIYTWIKSEEMKRKK